MPTLDPISNMGSLNMGNLKIIQILMMSKDTITTITITIIKVIITRINITIIMKRINYMEEVILMVYMQIPDKDLSERYTLF